MKKIFAIALILSISTIVFAQEKISQSIQGETQLQFNLDDFEIIHLSSGVIGETNIKVQVQQAPQPQGLSREEREQAIRRLQEIRTAMRKIEDATSQNNPELKAIMDKINQLQQNRKARLDELLADNIEYQQLKQKITSGDVQSSDAMQMAAIERRVAFQDEQIRQIDQEIRQLQQQRYSLLQTALQDNQEYQSQRAESQTIMQSFAGAFQRDGSVPVFQPSTQSVSDQPGWRRPGSADSNTTQGQSNDSLWRNRPGSRNR
ncbi:MAG: hypothetical protein ACP5JO_02780 [Candidatus Ratteibacteria bacterium]